MMTLPSILSWHCGLHMTWLCNYTAVYTVMTPPSTHDTTLYDDTTAIYTRRDTAVTLPWTQSGPAVYSLHNTSSTLLRRHLYTLSEHRRQHGRDIVFYAILTVTTELPLLFRLLSVLFVIFFNKECEVTYSHMDRAKLLGGERTLSLLIYQPWHLW